MQVVQYLLVECRNSIPLPRHSQQSEYLCNHKGSTDTENREGEGKKQEGNKGVRETMRDERGEMMKGENEGEEERERRQKDRRGSW